MPFFWICCPLTVPGMQIGSDVVETENVITSLFTAIWSLYHCAISLRLYTCTRMKNCEWRNSIAPSAATFTRNARVMWAVGQALERTASPTALSQSLTVRYCIHPVWLQSVCCGCECTSQATMTGMAGILLRLYASMCMRYWLTPLNLLTLTATTAECCHPCIAIIILILFFIHKTKTDLSLT